MTGAGTSTPTEPRPTPVYAALIARARGAIRGISLQVWILIGFSIGYVEVFSWFSYIRYLSFLTNAWDLGIFQQALWNSGHGGGLLYYTVELPWNPSGSFLGVHFSPILFLLVPIYTALPGPLTLMVLQCIVVAASAFPLYRIARKRIGAWPGLVLSGLYLMSPPLIGGLLFDFHVEAFLPVEALTLWVAWEERRWRLALVAAAFLLCTIEYAPILLGAIAFGFLVRQFREVRSRPSAEPARTRYRALLPPLVVTILSLPLTMLLFAVPKLVAPTTPPVSQVGPLGGSLSQILSNLVLHPSLIGPALSLHAAHKIQYLQTLWGSGLYAWPLGILGALPAIPWILVALLSMDPNYSVGVGNQYAFLVTPFLFLGTALAIGWIWDRRSRWLPFLRRLVQPALSHPRIVRWRARSEARPTRARWNRPALVLVTTLLVIAVPSQLAYSPLSPSVHYAWLWSGQYPSPQDHLRQAILDLIPPHASVSAEADMFPQLADRSNVYPYFVPGTEYLIVDVTSWWFTTALPPPMPPDQWLQELRHNVTVPYGVYASADGIVLYKLGYTGLPVWYEPFNRVEGATAFNIRNATIQVDPAAPRGAFVSPNQTAVNGTLWTGPHLLIPAGQFSIAMWVRAAAVGSGSIELVTQIENATGVETVVGSVVVPTWSLLGGWTAVSEVIRAPYPTYLNVTGEGTGFIPAVDFGGISVAQIPGPVVQG